MRINSIDRPLNKEFGKEFIESIGVFHSFYCKQENEEDQNERTEEREMNALKLELI